MPIVCKVCNLPFGSDTLLHRHLKTHKVSLASYYQTHYPRFDRFTGEIIKFKNKEFYFNSDFNDKTSLKKWIASNNKETVKSYVVEFLTNRKDRKGLVYTPTQVELRSLPIVGMKYINDNYGDYYQFCSNLGFKNKFSKYSFKTTVLNRNFKIIVDSREQKPLKFLAKTEVGALKFGDYTLKNAEKRNDCYIERKSLSDLYGTLSGGFERFCREIDRSVEAGASLIVLVEGSIQDVYAFPYTRQVYGKINISPEFIFHNVRDILQRYPTVQFLFVDNREEAARVVETIFASGEDYKITDLQYAYDCKHL